MPECWERVGGNLGHSICLSNRLMLDGAPLQELGLGCVVESESALVEELRMRIHILQLWQNQRVVLSLDF